VTEAAAITVVITTFNHEAYIEQAIESVLAQQTSFPVDVIVIDDCSTDKTGQLLDDLLARNPGRFEIRRPPANRNDHHDFAQALDECTTPYLAMLDGDDYWIAPHKLQRQVDLLDTHPEFVLCCHAVEPVAPDGSPADVYYEPRRAHYRRDDLWGSCFIHTGSTVFRRSGYDRLPDWYYESVAGDWELFLLFTLRGDVRYLDERMSAYRIHPGGTWSGLDHDRQARQVHDFYRHQRRAWGEGFRKNRAARLSQATTLAFRYGEAGKSRTAWRWLLEAIGRSALQRPGSSGPTRAEVKRLLGWRLRADAAKLLRWRQRRVGAPPSA
jgi:glycosyltransferase involved in cell wall biosynthesis